MGFDVFGPERHVRASNVDDGEEPRYDILTMPRAYGLHCPQLQHLAERFYDSTIMRFADGQVHALRNELVELQQAYRAQLEPEFARQRGVRAQDLRVRTAIMEQVLQQDPVYRVLEEFRLLCEEALAAEADVRCEGD
jgi:hypothetical protein